MTIPYSLVGVGELDSLSDQTFAQNLKDAMREFECKDTRTIKRFITTNQVFIAEKHKESRTYLAVNDEDKSLLGFFTLGLTCVEWEKVARSDEWMAISRNKRDNLSKGMYKTPDGYIGVFTIGELAKRSGLKKAEFPGSILLKEALAQILDAQKLIGGRFVLVDSLAKLYDSLYSKAGFVKVDDREAPDLDDDSKYYVSILPIEDMVHP